MLSIKFHFRIKISFLTGPLSSFIGWYIFRLDLIGQEYHQACINLKTDLSFFSNGSTNYGKHFLVHKNPLSSFFDAMLAFFPRQNVKIFSSSLIFQRNSSEKISSLIFRLVSYQFWRYLVSWGQNCYFVSSLLLFLIILAQPLSDYNLFLWKKILGSSHDLTPSLKYIINDMMTLNKA